MPSALPLVEDEPGQPPSLWSVGGSASALGAGVQGQASMNYGESGSGSENTHLWVAGVMVVALVIVVVLHVSGFRFATDIGITRG